MSRIRAGIAALALCAMGAFEVALHAQPPAQQPPTARSRWTPQQTQQIARDAYIFGYPLVTMELTRRQLTNVATPGQMAAPIGQFAHMRSYPTPDMKAVTTPNADTLYSSAWLDVSQDPVVLEVPDMGKRYWMMQMLDAWTDVFASPGARTSGEGRQKFLITGPGWTGTPPAGMKQLASPTAMVWIIARTYGTGTRHDDAAIHALQDHYRLTPLSVYGKHYTRPNGVVDPAVDMKTPPRDQVNALTGEQFFAVLARAMTADPPSVRDNRMVATLAQLGIALGRDFDASKLDPALRAAIQAAPDDALPAIRQGITAASKTVNGWLVTTSLGDYGTDYLLRASVAYAALGANLPRDAVYPMAKTDARGQPLDASKNDYTITFANRDALPPVRAFWSVTMYTDQMFFAPNPLRRYALGTKDRLATSKDGSIVLYLQSRSPGKDKETNWLPAPAGPFAVVLRMYWPAERPPSILDGTWQPPGIEATPKVPASAQR